MAAGDPELTGPASILVRHAAVIYPCAAPNEPPIVDGWVRVDGARITALGPEPCPDTESDVEVDGRGKVVIPGVVSHATNVLEHAELVADRIVRFAKAVGRENVIASTDCGLGGRVHPQIAWAKLAALAEGARRATKQLWA